MDDDIINNELADTTNPVQDMVTPQADDASQDTSLASSIGAGGVLTDTSIANNTEGVAAQPAVALDEPVAFGEEFVAAEEQKKAEEDMIEEEEIEELIPEM